MSFEELLETAARRHCYPILTSCTDGCDVAWMQNKDGKAEMLGSVRKANQVIKRGCSLAEEALLEKAAFEQWRPQLLRADDGCVVSWCKAAGGANHTIGSIRLFSPTEPLHVQYANTLPNKNMEWLDEIVNGPKPKTWDPFDL